MMYHRRNKPIIQAISFICTCLIAGGIILTAHAVSEHIYLPFIARNLPPTPIYYTYPLISEVMVYPFGKEPDNEWIELYHPGGNPIDLSYFKLGDAANRGDFEGMLQFPSGSVIKPGQVIVIANHAVAFRNQYGFKPDFEMLTSDTTVPSMIKYTSWSSGIIRLTNSGDEVILINAADIVVDAVSWGSSSYIFEPNALKVIQGYSIERKPAFQDRDLVEDFILQPNPDPGTVDLRLPTSTPTSTASPTNKPTKTPTNTPIPCGPAPLLITEVYYWPTGGETAAEWIEIYNAGDMIVNLACVKVGDEEERGGGEGMLVFPTGAIIEPGDVVVIANRADIFLDNYGFYPQFEMVNTTGEVPVMVKYSQWGTGNVVLRDLGDEVLLLDGDDEIIDVVAWGDSNFEEFQPPVSNVAKGHSIERYPADCDTDTAADWRDQPVPDPGQVDLIWPSPTPTTTISPTLTPSITPTPPPESGVLLISEVMYIPLGDEPDQEWIEIYNAGSESIVLSNFKIGDEEEEEGGYEGMLQFPNGASINPDQVIVIANRATEFLAIYGFLPDFEMNETHPDVPVMIPYLDWATGQVHLGNAGDEVLILDSEDYIIDAVSWGISNYFLDPPVPGVDPGHTIERFPANMDTDTNEDWIDQPVPNPGVVRFDNQTSFIGNIIKNWKLGYNLLLVFATLTIPYLISDRGSLPPDG